MSDCLDCYKPEADFIHSDKPWNMINGNRRNSSEANARYHSAVAACEEAGLRFLQVLCNARSKPKPYVRNIGALTIRIGLGGTVYYNSNQQPQNSIDNYKGPYIHGQPFRDCTSFSCRPAVEAAEWQQAIELLSELRLVMHVDRRQCRIRRRRQASKQSESVAAAIGG